MTTVVPKLSKSDAAPFKVLQSARAGGNPSASFARALKDADASKTAVQQAAELADNSVRLRGQTGDSDGAAGSAGSAEAGDDSIVNGNRSSKSGDLESSAKKPGDLSEAPVADSANVAGIAPPLGSDAGTSNASDAIASADAARTTEVANLLAPGVLAPGVSAKALELAQAAALWANGGLKDGSAEVAANLGLDNSSMSDRGGSTDSAATSANSAASAKSSPSASPNVRSTSQGSIISGVMDPSMFTAPGGGVGSAVSPDSPSVGPSGASIASASMSSGLAGGPIGFGGASAALQGAVQGAVQGAGQSTATNVLLNAGRLEASVPGPGATGPRAATSAHSGAVSVASALAAASSVRSAQSSALTDSVGLSATAGSITGTLSVPVMSGSAGADLGGNALGTQTGGAGSESGASSDRSRSGGSNAFTVQAANPSEPNVATALSGAPDASARPSRSVGLGTYANATTNAASSVDAASNQPPTRDVNAPATQASVAADPRAAWRDLRSKWDQPIRANSPKG